MKKTPKAESKPLIIYQEDKIKVVNALKEGKVDYLDLSSWGFQDTR